MASSRVLSPTRQTHPTVSWCGVLWCFWRNHWIVSCIHRTLLTIIPETGKTCCSRRIMPAYMMPILLNMLCKMFDNFPGCVISQGRYTILSIWEFKYCWYNPYFKTCAHIYLCIWSFTSIQLEKCNTLNMFQFSED